MGFRFNNKTKKYENITGEQGIGSRIDFDGIFDEIFNNFLVPDVSPPISNKEDTPKSFLEKEHSKLFFIKRREDDKEINLIIGLPGVDLKDIELVLKDKTLQINYTFDGESYNPKYIISEKDDVIINPDRINVSYSYGLLKVNIQKESPSESKSIVIPIYKEQY